MTTLSFKIADELIEIVSDSPMPSNIFKSFIPFILNHKSDYEPVSPLLTILLQKGDDQPSGANLVHRFETDSGRCHFFRDGNKYIFRIESDNAHPITLKTTKGTAVVRAITPSTFEIHRANFIFSIWMALSMAGAHNGISLIHSSVIVYKGKAILFLGESGAGKSTHTSLWVNNIEGSYLLNDDSPVVKISKRSGSGTSSGTSSDEKVLVCGSPWSGKGKIYKNEICPLAAVVRLKKAKVNKISQLNKLDAFAALYPSFPPALTADEQYTEDICTIISSIIKTTPVFELQALPDREAAFLVFESVFR